MKKIISLVTASIMALSFTLSISLTAFADETVTEAAAETTEAVIETWASRLAAVDSFYALAGSPEADKKSPFTDVDSKAVDWACQNGIIAGFEDGTFRPDALVTREQAAVIIYNYMKSAGKDVSNIEGMAIYEFSDYASISDWAVTAVRYCLNSGLITADDDREYNPQDSVSATDLAAVINTLSKM